MNKIRIPVVFILLLSLFSLFVFTGKTDGDDKIIICHIPPGNPDNPQTIVISESALEAHLAHGDTIGPCNGNIVKLSSNITSGTPPLTIYFQIDTNISSPITMYQMDFEGDGVIDDPPIADLDKILFKYDQEGIYYPTITVTDDQGNQYTDTIAVNVLSLNELNTLLSNKRSEVIDLLKLQDIQGALSYFYKSSQAKYKEAFTLLIDQLPEIFSVPEEFNLISVIDNVATCESVVVEVVDGNNRRMSYPVTFIKDENGFWKIMVF
jgi:PKD repeat protein